MCLIVVACFVNRVENGNALLQKIGCMSRAFDLTNGAVRYSGRLKKMPLFRSFGALERFTAEYGRQRVVHRNQPVINKSFDERFRVLKVWIFPCGAVEPEAPTGCVWQSDVISIAQIRWSQQWHE